MCPANSSLMMGTCQLANQTYREPIPKGDRRLNDLLVFLDLNLKMIIQRDLFFKKCIKPMQECI